MYTDIGKLLEEMRGIQEQLEQFFDEARERFRYTLEDGRVRFSREVQQLHRRYRVSSLRYLLDANLLSVLMVPVIYSMIIPLALMDAGFTLYQHLCFRACGLPRVRRGDYLVNDRQKFSPACRHRPTQAARSSTWWRVFYLSCGVIGPVCV